MPIKPLFIATDLMRARQILEGRRKGLALADAEWPTDFKNHIEELRDGLGVKS